MSEGHTPLPAPPGPPLRLRPTMLSDLDFVGTVEVDGHNLPFISPWERTQHEGALRFPDFRHFIVEAGAHGFAATVESLTRLMGKGEAQARRDLMELRGDAVEVDV